MGKTDNIELKGKDKLEGVSDYKNYYFTTNNENVFKIFEDGHIEVYITNNLSDYGNFVLTFR